MLRESRQKDRILHAAAGLFAQHGYHGVGMAQLEKAVGLQRGALYHHIGNKEALLYEISSSQLAVMVDVAEKLAASIPDDPEALLRELARTLLQNVAEHRLEWTVHYRDFNALTGERLEHVLALRARYERVWVRALHDGVTRAIFRPEVDGVASKGILGMFTYSYIWLNNDGRATTEQIADTFCDILLGGIRTASPPRRSRRR